MNDLVTPFIIVDAATIDIQDLSKFDWQVKIEKSGKILDTNGYNKCIAMYEIRSQDLKAMVFKYIDSRIKIKYSNLIGFNMSYRNFQIKRNDIDIIPTEELIVSLNNSINISDDKDRAITLHKIFNKKTEYKTLVSVRKLVEPEKMETVINIFLNDNYKYGKFKDSTDIELIKMYKDIITLERGAQQNTNASPVDDSSPHDISDDDDEELKEKEKLKREKAIKAAIITNEKKQILRVMKFKYSNSICDGYSTWQDFIKTLDTICTSFLKEKDSNIYDEDILAEILSHLICINVKKNIIEYYYPETVKIPYTNISQYIYLEIKPQHLLSNIDMAYKYNGKKNVTVKDMFLKKSLSFNGKNLVKIDREQFIDNEQSFFQPFNIYTPSGYVTPHSELCVYLKELYNEEELHLIDDDDLYLEMSKRYIMPDKIDKYYISQSINKMKDHIYHILCEGFEDKFVYFINFILHALFGVVTEKFLIFIGDEGCGKSVVFKSLIKYPFGEIHGIFLEAVRLHDRFNGFLENKQLVVLDEFSGDNKKFKENYDRLKYYVTASELMLEKKNQDTYKTDITQNFIAILNDYKFHEGSSKIMCDKKERRRVIYKTNTPTEDKNISDIYFKEIGSYFNSPLLTYILWDSLYCLYYNKDMNFNDEPESTLADKKRCKRPNDISYLQASTIRKICKGGNNFGKPDTSTDNISNPFDLYFENDTNKTDKIRYGTHLQENIRLVSPNTRLFGASFQDEGREWQITTRFEKGEEYTTTNEHGNRVKEHLDGNVEFFKFKDKKYNPPEIVNLLMEYFNGYGLIKRIDEDIVEWNRDFLYFYFKISFIYKTIYIYPIYRDYFGYLIITQESIEKLKTYEYSWLNFIFTRNTKESEFYVSLLKNIQSIPIINYDIIKLYFDKFKETLPNMTDLKQYDIDKEINYISHFLLYCLEVWFYDISEFFDKTRDNNIYCFIINIFVYKTVDYMYMSMPNIMDDDGIEILVDEIFNIKTLFDYSFYENNRFSEIGDKMKRKMKDNSNLFQKRIRV